MMGFGMMGAFGLIGLLFNALIIVGVVGLIVWAVKHFASPGNHASSTQTAREVLQVRYARGEITREQYQQILSDLG